MMLKKLIACLILLFPLTAFANASGWNIVPEHSTLSFTATQNGAPVTGEFKKFSGEINFDPNQLNTSHVKIIIDLTSVSDSYNKISDTLKSADWFNVKTFPKAIFEANVFSKTGDKTFEAKGNLSLRGKTVPITLQFTQEEYTETKARMKGTTTLQRTAFGVGQGEWSDTKAIKDDVVVNFIVEAKK